MNMKQGLIVLTLLMALSVSVPTLAQKHRHTPQGTELVDTTHNSSAVDAFSDTTTVDTVAGSNSRTFHYEWDSDNDEDVEKLLSWMDSTVEKHTWAAWTIAIIVIIFVFLLLLSPIIFIILLIWLVGRNRKQKVQMAQMAMEKGQPIPDQVLQQPEGEITDEYQKGLRQCFVGVGLAIFSDWSQKRLVSASVPWSSSSAWVRSSLLRQRRRIRRERKNSITTITIL